MDNEKHLIANLWDVDDSIVYRQWLARLIQFLRVGVRGGKKLDRLLNKYKFERAIPALSEGEASTRPISRAERFISFNPHSIRTIMPGVLGILDISKRCGIPNIIATGRAKHEEWIEMTIESLKRNGIADFFEGKFFTPAGMDSALSKAVVIKHLLLAYENVTFYEDDVETAIFVAKIFGEKVRIRLVRHKMNEYLYRKLNVSEYTNIELFDLGAAEVKYRNLLESSHE